MQDNHKGNILISYLFHSENVIANIDAELEMINDMQTLAEEWKAKGYIKRYIIADDNCISNKLKQE